MQPHGPHSSLTTDSQPGCLHACPPLAAGLRAVAAPLWTTPPTFSQWDFGLSSWPLTFTSNCREETLSEVMVFSTHGPPPPPPLQLGGYLWPQETVSLPLSCEVWKSTPAWVSSRAARPRAVVRSLDRFAPSTVWERGWALNFFQFREIYAVSMWVPEGSRTLMTWLSLTHTASHGWHENYFLCTIISASQVATYAGPGGPWQNPYSVLKHVHGASAWLTC